MENVKYSGNSFSRTTYSACALFVSRAICLLHTIRQVMIKLQNVHSNLLTSQNRVWSVKWFKGLMRKEIFLKTHYAEKPHGA